MEAFILTEEKLQERLLYWQNKLRLNDWIVKARITRERDMNMQNCAGEVSWTIENKSASIRILDPIDFPEGLMIEQDMENTLVHELLHLHLAPIAEDYNEDKHYTLFEEQAIDSISSAMIALERK